MNHFSAKRVFLWFGHLPSGSQDSEFSDGSLLGIFGGNAGDDHKLASITAVLSEQLVKKAIMVGKSPDETERFGGEAGDHLDELLCSGKHLQSAVLAVTDHHIASEECSCAISRPGIVARHTCRPEECPQAWESGPRCFRDIQKQSVHCRLCLRCTPFKRGTGRKVDTYEHEDLWEYLFNERLSLLTFPKP